MRYLTYSYRSIHTVCFFIILLLASLFISSLVQAACNTGVRPSYYPPDTTTPNYWYGGYVENSIKYNSADCNLFYRTPRPYTSTSSSDQTTVLNDSNFLSYSDAIWGSQSTYAGFSQSGFSVTGTLRSSNNKWINSGLNNDAYVYDRVYFNVPGAGATDTVDIPFELCSSWNSSLTASGFFTVDGAFYHTTRLNTGYSGFGYNTKIMLGNVINYPYAIYSLAMGSSNTTICDSGHVTVTGTDGQLSVWLSTTNLGARGYGENGTYLYDGTGTANFRFTSMPSSVNCSSDSGVMPGCERSNNSYASGGLSNSNLQKHAAGGGGLSRSSRSSNATGTGGGNSAASGGNGTGSNVSAYALESCRGETTKNPMNFAQGFKTKAQTDYAGGALTFTRIYRSDNEWSAGIIGKRWQHNYDRSLKIYSGTNVTTADMIRPDSTVVMFRKDSGSWAPVDQDITATLEEIYDNVPALIGYRYTTLNNTQETYDTDGKLTRIVKLGGQSVDLTYDGSDRLSTVTDESGKVLTFSYDGSNRVSSLVTPAGSFSYAYDGNGNLQTVTKPDTKTRTYHYENVTYVNALTGITDEKGTRLETYGYDNNGLANSTEFNGGLESYAVAYNSDDTSTVTNALGKDTIYTFQTINGVRKITEVAGQASTNCVASNKSYSYTPEGWLASKTDWEGNVTTYQYNSRGLQTSRTLDNDRPNERTITTTWDATFNKPDVITQTGKTTDYDYDSDGRVTSVTVTDTATSQSRTTTNIYYPNTINANGDTVLGRLMVVDGPRTDVNDRTLYTYDSNQELHRINSAFNYSTEITSRDSAGRPIVTTDVHNNGVQTSLTYDVQGRLITSMQASNYSSYAATTSYSYDDNGNITSITQPNGVVVFYTYDNLQRLIGVTDALGNTITYTLDDAGNRITEQYKDAGGTIKYTHGQLFDELSRLLTSVGANAQTQTYAYDKNSNMVSSNDAKNNPTSYAFDGLQRLVSTTDALNGVTSNSYNDLDQNTSVTDARSNTTTYTYNAFGDVVSMTSPDTGTTIYEVDEAGNRTKQTDARGIVTNYTYDALNRLTSVSYPSDPSLDVTLTYDTGQYCNFGKRRLCTVTDTSGTTHYSYDPLGRLYIVRELRGSLTFMKVYYYDKAGNVTGINLPSSRWVSYEHNVNGQIDKVLAQIENVNTTIASNISYLPFGSMNGMDYGNGLSFSASYDLDYRPTARNVNSIYNHAYVTDVNGNIIQKGARSYDYDELDRLTDDDDDDDDGSILTTYAYDAVHNRTSETVGVNPSILYSYPASSNILSSVGSDTYNHDAAGNNTDDNTRSYTYDAAGRVKDITIGGVIVGSYVYNSKNQRTSKTVNGITTHYVYGQGGLLYGEYDSNGNFIREYAYLNGAPLAQIDSDVNETIMYLHSDHLNTPRYGTDQNGTQVWAWDSGAFGKETASGSVTVNLRFPGQYFDSESGLHYNHNRYYDPQTGRYITSDPIGLAGGINTYGYVSASPMMFTDPEGKLQRGFYCPFPDCGLAFRDDGGSKVALYLVGYVITNDGIPFLAFKKIIGDAGFNENCLGQAIIDGKNNNIKTGKVWIDNWQVESFLRAEKYEFKGIVGKIPAKVGDIIYFPRTFHVTTVSSVSEDGMTVLKVTGLNALEVNVTTKPYSSLPSVQMNDKGRLYR